MSALIELRKASAGYAGRAVLHATPWNAAPGNSFETDPRDTTHRWGWTSPDLVLDGSRHLLGVVEKAAVPSAPAVAGLAFRHLI